MKTKVLIVPALIIISGFVALNYIKPDFDVYKQKRIERDAAKEHAAHAENIAKNVSALAGELESQKEKVAFVKRYLPLEKDEARMFDSINFLIGQAGLITSRIQVQKVEDETAGEMGVSPTFATSIDPIAAAEPSAMLDGPGPRSGQGILVVASYKAPAVKKYSLSVESLGGYSNIKDLLRKLEGFDRLQQIQGFKISTGENASPETEGSSGTDSAGTLLLTYNAILPYQETPSSVTGEGIVNIPGLKEASFNLTPIEKIQTAVTDTVPDTVLGTEGKANPFE